MATALKVPQMGESVVEGTIGKWFVRVGDKFKRDEPIVEIMTDKVNVEIPAEADGVMLEIKAKVGDIVAVGTEIAIIEIAGEQPSAAAEAKPAKTAPSPSGTAAAKTTAKAAPQESAVALGKQRLSPAVRRLIKQHGLDISQLMGSGSDGRVTVKDIEAYLAQQPSAPKPSATPAAAAGKAPAIDSSRVVEEIPIDRIRGLIADHMVQSRRTSPHVTTFDECDFTHLVEFRRKHVERIEKEQGVRVTYMPFIIKAATKALKEFPLVNASMTKDKIILKHYYNIGVAVARENGLIVPVVKHADQKSIIQIMIELKDLGDRARTNKLTPVDIEDSTFSVTNAGGYGALNSTPIISQPNVAILGIHAIQKRPVVRDGEIVIRDMMNLCLSFDHRLVDGHYAVQFLRKLITYLEEPELMLL